MTEMPVPTIKHDPDRGVLVRGGVTAITGETQTNPIPMETTRDKEPEPKLPRISYEPTVLDDGSSVRIIDDGDMARTTELDRNELQHQLETQLTALQSTVHNYGYRLSNKELSAYISKMNEVRKSLHTMAPTVFRSPEESVTDEYPFPYESALIRDAVAQSIRGTTSEKTALYKNLTDSDREALREALETRLRLVESLNTSILTEDRQDTFFDNESKNIHAALVAFDDVESPRWSDETARTEASQETALMESLLDGRSIYDSLPGNNTSADDAQAVFFHKQSQFPDPGYLEKWYRDSRVLEQSKPKEEQSELYLETLRMGEEYLTSLKVLHEHYPFLNTDRRINTDLFSTLERVTLPNIKAASPEQQQTSISIMLSYIDTVMQRLNINITSINEMLLEADRIDADRIADLGTTHTILQHMKEEGIALVETLTDMLPNEV